MPEHLLDSPILYSLALTLLHFLWQGCLVALVLKCLLSVTSYQRPQLRYLWSMLALGVCLILPIITFSIIYTPDYLSASQQGINSIIPLSASNITTVMNASWYQHTIGGLPFISLAWGFAVVVLSLRLLFSLKKVNDLTKIDTLAVSQPLQERFDQLYQRFNLWRKPQLLISLTVTVPMAIGWLKPVILLPATMISGLTSAQLEMLILHELAHIKRHDYLVNFLQTLVEILLFFHPAVRWISTQMRNEREYCSDDMAVKHCGNAVAYAHTLADTASLCHQHKLGHRDNSIPTMAMAASGGDLKQRVIRLIEQEHNCTADNDSGKLLASIVILFAVLSVFAKPFVDNRMIDWGTSKLSLMQSAGDLLQRRNAVSEQPLSQTSLAQQLVQQSAPQPLKTEDNVLVASTKTATPLHTTNNETPIEEKVIHITENTVPVASVDTHLAINRAELTQSVVNNTQQPQKIALLKASKNTEIALTNIAPEQVKEERSRVIPRPIIGKQQNKRSLLSQTSQTSSDLMFERTNSAALASSFENPYAAQISSLIDEPLPTNLGTNEFNSAYKNVLERTSRLTAQQPLLDETIERTTLIKRESATLITSVEPRYPSVAKRKGIELDIKVNFVINENGRVTNIQFEEKSK